MTIAKVVSNIQATVLMLAIVLSSAHAKDVVKDRNVAHKQRVDTVKLKLDDSTNAKVITELHNHVDKQTLKTFYHGGDIQQQADRRSLWQLEKTNLSLKDEFTVGMSIWLKMLAARLLP